MTIDWRDIVFWSVFTVAAIGTIGLLLAEIRHRREWYRLDGRKHEKR